MEQVLLVVQVLLAIALVGMVLLQRSDSDGFGLGSGGGSNLLSGRASANLMTRTTAIIAALFILNSLALSVIAAHGRPASIIDTINAQQADETKPVAGAPAVPLAGNADKKVAAPEATAPAQKPAVPAAESSAEPVKKLPKKAAKPAVPTDSDQPHPTPAENE